MSHFEREHRYPETEAEAENQLPQDLDSKVWRNVFEEEFGDTPQDNAHGRGVGSLGA